MESRGLAKAGYILVMLVLLLVSQLYCEDCDNDLRCANALAFLVGAVLIWRVFFSQTVSFSLIEADRTNRPVLALAFLGGLFLIWLSMRPALSMIW